jgi:hypothetical protein
MDRHVLRYIELQPLDVSEQRHRVQVDIRKRSSGRRRPVEIRNDEDLVLRQINDQHVVGVIKIFDMVQHYASLFVADRVLIRETWDGRAREPPSLGVVMLRSGPSAAELWPRRRSPGAPDEPHRQPPLRLCTVAFHRNREPIARPQFFCSFQQPDCHSDGRIAA